MYAQTTPIRSPSIIQTKAKTPIRVKELAAVTAAPNDTQSDSLNMAILSAFIDIRIPTMPSRNIALIPTSSIRKKSFA